MQVLWLQTALWHGELQVPAGRPDFAACRQLADCSDEQLRWLAGQQASVGRTQITMRMDSAAPTSRTPANVYCQWHREVAYRPQHSARSPGRLVWGADERSLEEHGIDTPYRVLWQRLGASAAPSATWRRTGDGRRDSALLLLAGGSFFYLRDRPRGATDVTAGQPPDIAALDLDASFGPWDTALRAGCVQHSTLPWREGRIVELDARWQLLEV